MKLLLIAEHNHQTLSAATLATITAASALSHEIILLIAGKNCLGAAQDASKYENITKVIYADDDSFSYSLAENMAALITSLAKDYAYILAPATTFGKNILPRVAAQMDMAMVSDVIRIENLETFVRPLYAGNALATIQNQEPIKIITTRPSAFTPAKQQTTSAPIENLINLPATFSNTKFIKTQASVSARPDLSTARIVVSGGRGLQNKQNFALIEQLADCLHAAIGASRAAVDAGFISNDFQVGQTGKIVAPDIYFAIGISGAIQHIAGIKDSKIIIAINKDPDAPIFQNADYGLIEDLFSVVPDIIKQLRETG